MVELFQHHRQGEVAHPRAAVLLGDRQPPKAQLAELGAVLEQRFGRKLTLEVRIDPSLIGGVRATVGDEVLDTSVRARLERMKTALIA